MAYASPEVRALARALSDRVRTVGKFALMVADERAGHPTGQAVPPRQQLDHARAAFDADVLAIDDRIGAELRGDV